MLLWLSPFCFGRCLPALAMHFFCNHTHKHARVQGAMDTSRAALEQPLPTFYEWSVPPGSTAAARNTEPTGGPGYQGAPVLAVGGWVGGCVHRGL